MFAPGTNWTGFPKKLQSFHSGYPEYPNLWISYPIFQIWNVEEALRMRCWGNTKDETAAWYKLSLYLTGQSKSYTKYQNYMFLHFRVKFLSSHFLHCREKYLHSGHSG